MDFKSKRLPSTDVRLAMQGKDCLAFAMKKRKRRHSDQRIIYKR
jgi:hypothetical protein